MSTKICDTCMRQNCAKSGEMDKVCVDYIESKVIKAWQDKQLESGLKDSGARQEYSSGMVREPEGQRERFDLILPLTQPYDTTLLYRWANVLTAGCVKYSSRNWEKANSVEEYQRFKASAWRHFIKFMSGRTDEDHAASLLFNINGMVYLQQKLNLDGLGNQIQEKELPNIESSKTNSISASEYKRGEFDE